MSHALSTVAAKQVHVLIFRGRGHFKYLLNTPLPSAAVSVEETLPPALLKNAIGAIPVRGNGTVSTDFGAARAGRRRRGDAPDHVPASSSRLGARLRVRRQRGGGQ